MPKVRVADYIFEFLARSGVTDVFVISGGGNMHLVDALGRNKRLKYWCSHHEQASAMGAEGFARMGGRLGAVLVTTGPGGTNALTGLAGAWLDSIPLIFISGQVKLADTIFSNPGLRQFGDQELNIVDMVRPATKYAEMVVRPSDIRFHLGKAIYLAQSGRPGPVWIDVPLDIQATNIAPSSMRAFRPPTVSKAGKIPFGRIFRMLKVAKRPLFILGHGIRSAGAQARAKKLVERLGIPAVTSILAKDLLGWNHPLNAGTPGIAGQRGANFVVQNADLILSIGSRLMLRQIGFNYDSFAPKARKIVVDIDGGELAKRSIRADVKVRADAGLFIDGMLSALAGSGVKYDSAVWTDYCRAMGARYNGPDAWHRAQDRKWANSYLFIDELSSRLPASVPVITSNGTAYISTLQAFKQKAGQRLIYNKACASMGYGLPAAIGACIANRRRPVVCLENDGSLQMNIQELQTVVHHAMPVKIVVFNNDGYLSIKITQQNYFPDNICASTPGTGVSCPDMRAISAAYGIPFMRVKGMAMVGPGIEWLLRQKGPLILEVMMDPWQMMFPKLSSEKLPDGKMVSKPLDDMFPFLDRDEFKRNQIVTEGI